jgi:ADP-ribosylglycohydrolase
LFINFGGQLAVSEMKRIFQSKSLLGLAIGDALGEPAEWFNPWDYEEEYGGKIKDFIKEPKITDDTILTMLVAESIIENQRVIREEIARKFVENRHKLYRIGPTTREALKRLAKNPKSKAVSGNTNGAAVRVVPVGLIHSDVFKVNKSRTCLKEVPTRFQKLIEDTMETTIITHGEDVAISAACAISCAVSAAVDGLSKDGILLSASTGARRGLKYGTETWSPVVYEKIEEAVNIIHKIKDTPEINRWNGIGAWQSIPTAIAVFYRTDSFEEAVLTAVNLGGDTDTIGAIVGALAGAYYKQIPDKWIQKIPEREKLLQLEKELLEIRKRKQV